MTRKHFEALAETLRTFDPDPDNVLLPAHRERIRQRIVTEVAWSLKRMHPRFDTYKFRRSATPAQELR